MRLLVAVVAIGMLVVSVVARRRGHSELAPLPDFDWSGW